MALWGVRDPGNVGTVLRSALAFGAASVALGPDTADPFGPKAVRASMGAIFAMPVARVGERRAAARRRASRSWPPRASRCAGRCRARSSSAPSAPACRDEVVEACDAVAHIPIAGDSLNAAMAATIALYESTRVPAR